MHNVAMAAKRNRKSSTDKMIDELDGSKTPKKSKGRAPAPPEENSLSINTNIENGEPECVRSHKEVGGTEGKTYPEKHPDEIFKHCSPKYNKSHNQHSNSGPKENGKPTINNLNENGISGYALDSDAESDNQSSVNTIALNSSDITIHHIEDNEEIQNRRTASTGDLSKLQRAKKGGGSTLERAQSLDIADTGITLPKKHKSDNLEMTGSDESVYEKYMMYKEPRLSLVLDGLNTFQRSRLKKSTEWGNLEDAILNLDKDTNSEESKPPSYENSSSREFDALVNKINEIKNEDVKDVENEMVNDIAKKDVLHKTYNDLTEIMNDEKSNIMEELSKQHSDRIILKNLSPYDDISVLKDMENAPSSIDDTSLENVELKILPEEPLLMETTAANPKAVLTATSPPPEDLLETNGITTSEIEMYLSEDNADQKAEAPKRKSRNQIWPTFETQTEKPTIPPRKPEPPLRRPEPHLREKHRHPEVESVEKKNENIITVTKVEVTAVEEPQIITNLTELDIPTTESEAKKCQTTTTITLNSGVNVSKPILGNEEPAVPSPSDKSRVQISSRFFKPKLMKEFSENLIIAERLFGLNDPFYNSMDSSSLDLNVSDDMKVSRHSLGNLQTEATALPLEKSSKQFENNISSIMIESPYQTSVIDQLSASSSLPINENYVADSDASMNNTTSLYTTALDQTLTQANESLKTVSEVEVEEEDKNVPVTTPDIIKNITLTEVINTVNTQMSLLDNKPKSLKLQVVGDSESDENNKNVAKKLIYEETPVDKNSTVNITDSSDSNDSLTFVTEIRVSPNASVSSNISDTDTYSISPEDPSHKNLENKFESYVKNFETNRKMFGSPVNSTTHYKTESRIPSKITSNSDKNQPEKDLQKIHEIVEEQLKKLPEMRFSTSSYESTSKIPEKRSSHIEQIRSNFEKNSNDKSPTKPKAEGVKSRIPVATQKTPPTSPERRDSRPDSEINSDILELMSSKVHSTPVSSNLRYQPKIPTKNVTVTSIRGNSKIPSGIPGRPPIPTRKPENLEAQSNGNGESSFKQWVFTQSESAVTNIIVDNFKPEQK
ncbi:uncharacterized protein LOC112906069 [Agrilus planipennis]|uniref:Uncharacterized protein LOC112906069 n=1 Tax=Agrilus planipennis TaxID=224129 RepID=A0A7F5RHK8_AGRPL|nr:uncharacterized protein LOC112906069 [Agrilus planipennis]